VLPLLSKQVQAHSGIRALPDLSEADKALLIDMVDTGFLRIHSDLNDFSWSLAASNNSGSGPGGELELVGRVRRGKQPSSELGGLQALASARAYSCTAPMNTLAYFDSHQLHRVKRAGNRRCIINYLTRLVAGLGRLLSRRFPGLARQAASLCYKGCCTWAAVATLSPSMADLRQCAPAEPTCSLRWSLTYHPTWRSTTFSGAEQTRMRT